MIVTVELESCHPESSTDYNMMATDKLGNFSSILKRRRIVVRCSEAA